MEKKGKGIKIKDLDVDLDELQKKDPEILKKIRGGAGPYVVGPVRGSYYCPTVGCVRR